MGETLEAELSFPTAQAVQNAKNFTQTILEAEKALDALDAAAEGVKETVTKTGEAETQASKTSVESTKAAAREKKSADEAAQRGFDKSRESGDKLGKTQSFLMGQVSSMVSGYLGLQVVFKILDEIETRMNKLRDAQRDLVGGQLNLDRELQSMIFNLGLPQTQAGQQQARKILGQLQKAAPGTKLDALMGIVGSAASFGVTPQTPEGMQTITEVARSAGPMLLDKESGGNVVKLMQSLGVLNPQRAGKFLSQMTAAGQTVAVEDPNQLVSSMTRAVLPLTQQGLGFEQASGLFGAAAVGETSALKVATRVQQFSQLFAGSDEKTRAELYKRAEKAGLIGVDTQKQVNEAVTAAMKALTPKDQAHLDQLNRDMTDIAAREEKENNDFKRDLKEIETARSKAATAGRDTKGFATRVEARNAQHTEEIRQLASRRTGVQSDLGLFGVEERTKAQAQAFGAMPIEQRRQILYDLHAKAGSPTAQRQLLEGLTTDQETLRAATVMMGPAGQQAFARTRGAIAGASPTLAAEQGTAFLGTTVATETAREQQTLLDTTSSVGAGEQFAVGFTKTAEEQIKGLRVQGKPTDGGTYFGWTDEGGGFTDAGWEAHNQGVLLLKDMQKWYDALDPTMKSYIDSNWDARKQFGRIAWYLLRTSAFNLPSVHKNGVLKYAAWFGELKAATAKISPAMLDRQKKISSSPEIQKIESQFSAEERMNARKEYDRNLGAAKRAPDESTRQYWMKQAEKVNAKYHLTELDNLKNQVGGPVSMNVGSQVGDIIDSANGGNAAARASVQNIGGVGVASAGGGVNYQVNIGTVVSRGDNDDLNFAPRLHDEAAT